MIKYNFYSVRNKLKKKIFIEEDEVGLTYGKLDELINYIVSFLSKSSKEIIVIQSESVIGEIVVFLGVLESGNIPIIVHYEIIDLNFLGEFKSNEDILLIDNIKVKIYKGKLKANKIDNILLELLDEKGYLESFGVISSGTTGTPKVILRSSKSWIIAFKYQNDIFHINSRTKCFILGSLSFSANLNMVMNIFDLGGSIFTTKSKFPKTWIKKMKKCTLTSVLLVPSRYKLLLKSLNVKLPFVKSVVSCGEKLPYKLFKELEKVFNKGKVIEYYGSSETSFISYNNSKTLSLNNNGVGKVFPEVGLYFENSGEIKVNTPYAAYGVSTEFLLNDYGYLDDNKVLVLEGRGNEVINKGGRKISLRKIKNILVNFDLFDEMVLLKKECEVKGEEILLFGVLKDSDLSLKEIKERLRWILLKDEMPKIILKDEMPRNLNGKVDFKRLIK